ncbi:hypothetical protein LUD75_18745 [Epilithonimonas sp. JDS]|uniref:hypothetical protein n=1 Tax=Epilithonimonas sp. JDS TaxID=2902797 RepID=UPI001E41E8F2|nr:hypothetical protein [Epilithonimonas sp. JDS]MCD9856769.1 hypothetical protein [Epilithonimonas sp. JDS]
MISILLLSLYLVSTTELYQLLKIPDLIEHYCEHKALNSEMSLIAFLKTHYDHPVKDGDYGKDTKLPFIIHSSPLALVFTINPRFSFEIKDDSFRLSTSHKIPSCNENFCYKGFTSTVWEPPRHSQG